MLECSTIIPELTVAVTSTIQYSTEDDSHGTAIASVLQDRAKIHSLCFINTSINIRPPIQTYMHGKVAKYAMYFFTTGTVPHISTI